MNTQEVGEKLVSLCREHKDAEALDMLFDKNAVSIEAAAMPNMPQEVRGLDAIKRKGEWWRDNHEVHSVAAEGPFPNGDSFAVRFAYDLTRKATGERVKMDEIGVYTVRGGKVVSEKFFYAT